MTFFNPEISIKVKNTSQHPWERKVKDLYLNKIKFAHNSVKNPQYPQYKKKEKHMYQDKIKFTIIGNRITEEFIYCVKLAQGMHKYRRKTFDAPVIRGVNSVEWPITWHSLKLQYGGLAYCIKSQVAVLINDKFLGGCEELKELIHSKYIYHIFPDYHDESISQFTNYIKSSGRSCAYMHFAIENEHVGTMIFMLYSEIVPYTCENFLRLCNTKKGGYGGTPVHRIVKDGWIQCGGYGLKSSDLSCENFIVPHDRRGVLCMANEDRHINCSTQFFVLLQPAPWMAHKYVAFGQLIEGDETLKKIENIPTWYESPKQKIVIHQAGILNMDCQHIAINKGVNSYIQGHIENLNAVGELFYEVLLDKVFVANQLRYLDSLRIEHEEECELENVAITNIHETKRFIRRKEDIEMQLEKSQVEAQLSPTVTNDDFDVDEYDYEPEEYEYKQISVAATVSVVVTPEKPYYIPLTDVPYPGEVDSTYDLKKLLKGDYCLESDLQKSTHKITLKEKESVLLEFENIDVEESVSEEDLSLDSDDEREIKEYVKMNADNVSFAGNVIRSISKKYENLNVLKKATESEKISDEMLRKFRVALKDYRSRGCRDKKVSISARSTIKPQCKIKRRQTGFVRPEDLEKIKSISNTLEYDKLDSTCDISRKVRIDPSAGAAQAAQRRSTVLKYGESQADPPRQSVLTRLYDDLSGSADQMGPTLKDYKPISEKHPKKLFMLTNSPNDWLKYEDNPNEKITRHSLVVANDSLDQMLNIQHGKKVARKISSDYMKTIDQMEHKFENSLRGVEYAKTRPMMSVTEYQMKNKKYQEELKASSSFEVSSSHGLRLPGDTPLYSEMSVTNQMESK